MWHGITWQLHTSKASQRVEMKWSLLLILIKVGNFQMCYSLNIAILLFFFKIHILFYPTLPITFKVLLVYRSLMTADLSQNRQNFKTHTQFLQKAPVVRPCRVCLSTLLDSYQKEMGTQEMGTHRKPLSCPITTSISRLNMSPKIDDAKLFSQF